MFFSYSLSVVKNNYYLHLHLVNVTWSSNGLVTTTGLPNFKLLRSYAVISVGSSASIPFCIYSDIVFKTPLAIEDQRAHIFDFVFLPKLIVVYPVSSTTFFRIWAMMTQEYFVYHHIDALLACWGCCDTVPPSGWPKQEQFIVSQFWG